MSWSVISFGKAPAVAKKIAEDIQKYKCSEPEETIKQKVGEVIASALGSFPDDSVVKVDASGSQSLGSDGKAINQLSVTIQPQYGFVE